MKTLAVLVALAPLTAIAAQTWVREPARPGAVARGDGVLRRTMLAAHNQARADFGSPPLAWDARLASDARAYARELARTDNFRHSTGRRGAEAQGETLWTGTRLDYDYAEMFGHWLAERRDFRPGIVPNVSRTGRFDDVAHYVQIVWPTSRRIGCAMASNDRRDYLVCRYAPPGAVVGRRLG